MLFAVEFVAHALTTLSYFVALIQRQISMVQSEVKVITNKRKSGMRIKS